MEFTFSVASLLFKPFKYSELTINPAPCVAIFVFAGSSSPESITILTGRFNANAKSKSR